MKKLILVSIFFLNFTLNYSQRKVVLVETFTSTTCPPCVPANQYFDSWYSSYPEKNSVAVIKYHVWWPSPGNDPFYLANPDEVVARRVYYNINAVPNGVIDGTNYGSNYPNWITVIQNKTSSTPMINLSFVKGLLVDEIKVNVESLNNYSGNNLTLHVAVVESKINYTGTNGDPVHNFVMRKMFPNSSGTTFNLSAGERKAFSFQVTLSNNWNKNNCAVVAFVQTSGVKDVVQSVMQDYNIITSVKESKTVPNEFSLEQNFPNPFNPTTSIIYRLPTNNFITLKIYDLLGREIETLVDEYQQAGIYVKNFRGTSLPSGVYIYQLTASNISKTKRMVLIK